MKTSAGTNQLSQDEDEENESKLLRDLYALCELNKDMFEKGFFKQAFDIINDKKSEDKGVPRDSSFLRLALYIQSFIVCY